MNNELLILETLKRMEDKIDQVDKRLDQVEEKMDQGFKIVNEKIDRLQRQVDLIAGKTQIHDQKFKKMSELLAEQ